jgi:hypothetical protein
MGALLQSQEGARFIGTIEHFSQGWRPPFGYASPTIFSRIGVTVSFLRLSCRLRSGSTVKRPRMDSRILNSGARAYRSALPCPRADKESLQRPRRGWTSLHKRTRCYSASPPVRSGRRLVNFIAQFQCRAPSFRTNEGARGAYVWHHHTRL